MAKEIIHANSVDAIQKIKGKVQDLPSDGSYEVIINRIPNTRTDQQNRALHKYLSLLAEKLNAAGWSFYRVMNRRADSSIQKLIKTHSDSNKDQHPFSEGVLYACRFIQEALPVAEIDWTTGSCKESLWRPIQQSLIEKDSTADADKSEYTEVYENLNRVTSSVFGVAQDWPVKKEEE